MPSASDRHGRRRHQRSVAAAVGRHLRSTCSDSPLLSEPMKIESPAFTLDDVKSFMDTYLERERDILADRLQKASDRLAALAPSVKSEPGDESSWNAHELLAHLAVLSKFYGVLVH